MNDTDNLREYLQDYAAANLEKSKSGLYSCPLCGSGRGKNHTGAFSITGDKWHCFSCNEGGDIFDLVGKLENLSDYPQQVARVREIYGGTGSQQPQPRKKPLQSEPQEEQTNYTAYFEECNRRLAETTYYRGISFETLNRFKVGYDPNWKPKGRENAIGTPRLIIPTSEFSYIARDTRPNADPAYKAIKQGKTHLFNEAALTESDRPIFIVEGEIDALSLIDLDAVAVGIGGTSGINRLLQAIDKNRPQQPLIVALDHDAAGQKADDELIEELEARAIDWTRADTMYLDYKDANEAMNGSRAAFTEKVREAEAEAMEVAALRKKEQEEAQAKLEEAQEAEREAEIKKYRAENNAATHLVEFMSEIDASVNTPHIETGFKRLDESLDGGLYEGLYIIGAISSLGKTTFTLQIADQIARGGHDVLIFSLEMARSELMAKSISRLTYQTALATGGRVQDAKTTRGITAGERWKNYNRAEKDLIAFAVNEYAEYAENIFIEQGLDEIGVKEIRERVEKHKRLMGAAPVVVIDYLQILKPTDPHYSDKQNTDKAVMELKKISRDSKTPVIAISSFNRASYKEAVTMEAFKESGAIEYSSDVLIGLQLEGAGSNSFDATEEKQKDPRNIEAVILKNRNGRTGDKIAFEYKPMFNHFKEKPQQTQTRRRI